MSRIQFFEIHDQPWCPTVVRDGVRDGLYTAWKLLFWQNTTPHLRDLLNHAEEPKIVDLCSGGAGPMPLIVDGMAPEFPSISATLTDLYPFTEWKNPLGENERIKYESQPIDATNVPAHIGACRTLFEALHHFTPEQATGILSDAVQSKQPIAIFEFQRSSLLDALINYPLNIVVFIASYIQLFHTPFSWRKLFWILIPVIPFVLIFDGIVSVLRTYSTRELTDLAQQAGTNGYRWEIRQSRDKGKGIMTCLIGWPDDDGGVHIVDY